MTEKPENTDASEQPVGDDLGYNELVESRVDELFKRFKNMRTDVRMNLTTAYCLARALSNKAGISNEDTRLEYLKEAGRNDRSMLKSDSYGVNDDEDPLFTK